jgi:rhodanese-related sulfurtransferase
VSYQEIYAAEVAELLQQEKLLIIDQRDMAARSKGQLADAQAATDEIINKLVRQRRQDPAVLVYCYHGNQSRELCSFLGTLGLNRVYNLVGGWEAWENWQQQAALEPSPC